MRILGLFFQSAVNVLSIEYSVFCLEQRFEVLHVDFLLLQPQQPPVGNVTSAVTAVSRRSPSPASSGPVPAAAMSPMGSTPPSLVMPAGAAAPSSSSP